MVQGAWNGSTITAKELHRFANEPVTVKGTVYWDILRLFFELKQGMLAAKQEGGFSAVSVDTWGVDFALLDKTGALLGNPVHYRDSRTAGMLAHAFQILSAERLFHTTGNQLMEINTLFQLLALQKHQPEMLENSACALMLPDLLTYFLSGEKCAESSIASTSTLLDIQTGQWAEPLFAAFGLKNIFPEVTASGTVVGQLLSGLREELGLPDARVISGAGHDTQNALVAVPANIKDFLFISSGTWSLVGTESDAPMLDSQAAAFGLSNERAVGGKISVLKNITGLWLLQESRRHWKREGTEYSYAQLEALAREAQPLKAFIDVEDPRFVASGDMPGRIQAFCRETGQRVPETVGEIVRCIYESLAMKYRAAMEQLQCCAGKTYPCIHIVGGGAKDGFLSQLTADVCGLPVTAGPVEATVYGNLAVQLMALGEIDSLKEAREILKASEPIKSFAPRQTRALDEGFHRFKEMFSC